MVEIKNYNDCPLSIRAGSYGGKSGLKDGIEINGEYWIAKYPKTTKGMAGEHLSYTTSPLSEYLGSQIYQALGFETHETMLGLRNNKLVVLCKDFLQDNERLYEVRTLKNQANPKLSKMLEESFSETSNFITELREILLHLQYNDILSCVPGMTERFWDTAIVDILIYNNDRNSGNWGIIAQGQNRRIAPVYDNGAAFFNKMTDEALLENLNHPKEFENKVINAFTAFGWDNKRLSAKKLLQFESKEKEAALIRNVPNILAHASDIQSIFCDLPETFEGISVCSQAQRKVYMEMMNLKMNKLLIPAYNLYAEKKIDVNTSFLQIEEKYSHIDDLLAEAKEECKVSQTNAAIKNLQKDMDRWSG